MKGSIFLLLGPGTTLQHDRAATAKLERHVSRCYCGRGVLFMAIYLFKHLLYHQFLVCLTKT